MRKDRVAFMSCIENLFCINGSKVKEIIKVEVDICNSIRDLKTTSSKI
jgi:hypothetical protein